MLRLWTTFSFVIVVSIAAHSRAAPPRGYLIPLIDLAGQVQRQVLAAQLTLAVDLDRPVVIHMREAVDDTLGLLRDAGAGLRGVLHCFSETRDVARRALDLGFYLSLSGILTFPKAGDLRDTVRAVPLDRLLVETDSPFLAPVPHRGKRNEPAWVARVVDTLASVHGIEASAMARRTSANFRALFAP